MLEAGGRTADRALAQAGARDCQPEQCFRTARVEPNLDGPVGRLTVAADENVRAPTRI